MNKGLKSWRSSAAVEEQDCLPSFVFYEAQIFQRSKYWKLSLAFAFVYNCVKSAFNYKHKLGYMSFIPLAGIFGNFTVSTVVVGLQRLSLHQLIIELFLLH